MTGADSDAPSAEACWPELPGDRGLVWSACVTDPQGTVVWSHDADRVLRTASIGKLLLLLEVDRRLEAGDLAPDLLVPKPVDIVHDSGLWHTMAVAALPVTDLATLVGAVSDNLATNALLRVVGVAAVDVLREQLGLVDTRLLDEVRPGRGPEHPPTLSVGRADELCRLMGHIAAAGPDSRVAGWLAGSTDLSMVAAELALDPLAHRASDRPPLTLLNKTGTDLGIRADVGHVSLPGRDDTALTYAVLSSWDPRAADRTAEVLATMRAVGRTLRAHLGVLPH